MKKNFYISVIFFLLLIQYGYAQMAYFDIGKTPVEMQTKVLGDSTLSFFYMVVFHADSTLKSYNGYVRTEFITNKNSEPSKSLDSVNIAATTLEGQLNDGDTAKIFGHFRVNNNYFNNGSDNIIVIWPTGGKGSGSSIYCKDSITYFKTITVTGLSGFAGNKKVPVSARIYPNPANTYLNLQITDLSPMLIKIWDMTGKTLFEDHDIPARINISTWKNGTYFLEIDGADNQKATYTFIIGK